VVVFVIAVHAGYLLPSFLKIYKCAKQYYTESRRLFQVARAFQNHQFVSQLTSAFLGERWGRPRLIAPPHGLVESCGAPSHIFMRMFRRSVSGATPSKNYRQNGKKLDEKRGGFFVHRFVTELFE